jgi:hypothetical protein
MMPEIVIKKIEGYRMKNLVEFFKKEILGNAVSIYEIKDDVIREQAEKLKNKIDNASESKQGIKETLRECLIYPAYYDGYPMEDMDKYNFDIKYLIKAYHADGGERFKGILDDLPEY